MNDEELIALLDTFGPVPGCEARPAGITRLLAFRLHALCRVPQISRGYLAPRVANSEVLASDLGPVLLEYLHASGVSIELKEMTLKDGNFTALRGVMVLDTFVCRLLPKCIAQFGDPPLQINRFPGALKMSANVAIWVLMGELYRLDAPSKDLRELFLRISELPPEWREAYPEMAARYVVRSPGAPPERDTKPPESELKVNPASIVRSMPPGQRPRKPKSQHGCTWKLTDEGQVLERLKAQAEMKDSNPAITYALESLSLGYERQLPLARRQQADAVDRLVQRFPNFAPVCRWVSDQVRLCALMRVPLRLPPMLLLGPPGIGKTMFCIELAQELGAEACVRSLAEMSASWLITGGSAQWSNGRPGVIAEHLSRCPKDRIPWFVFDELDKASSDRGFPVGPALLGLLEPYTAQRFRDECLEIEMDVRPAGFIFTANELKRIRPELISRLHVIAVPAPTAFEMPAVVASVDAQLRKEQPELSKVFSPIDTQVLLHLEAVAPRELRRHLQAGYANAVRRTAKLRGRRDLLLKDLPSGVGGSHDASDRRVH
ncbi:AAA family ATPase [Polycyclovorans algicola]|uniref:AAA family ATPase n=1 Tax=Polycyclovorans algicola TaxID=616992 RepID=UPI0006940AF3|nr:AAA family ATPase [Polycyclovorans algicola]